MNYLCASLAAAGMNLCEPSVSAEVHQAFIEHVASHGLSYGTQEEFNFRLQQFAKKDAEIKEINASQNSFTVGHNLFSTWTDAEYKKLLGFKMPAGAKQPEIVVLDESNLTDSVDWRTKGAVNPVKNQGMCGSCWAFSATAAIEGHHFIQTGELLSLAEQQFVDCDTSSYGCNGGWQSNAMTYAEKHGQELEADYPYTARDGQCQASSSKGKVEVSNIAQVTPKSVAQLKAAIAKGPTSVTVEADRSVFQMYTSGILDSTSCGTQLDHAITAVGYGSENGKDYYIVRNSWGASWGDNGYIKIAAVDGAGICGIQQVSVWPTTD
jgi:C1A family cysteine protease